MIVKSWTSRLPVSPLPWTATFDVLDSPAYRTALTNPTDWSTATLARFKNMIRAVARITISRGQGRGAALGIVRLRPPEGGAEKVRTALSDQLDPARSVLRYPLRLAAHRSILPRGRRCPPLGTPSMHVAGQIFIEYLTT